MTLIGGRMKELELIQDLLTNDDIYEISIDSYHEVYVFTKDGWKKELPFKSKEELIALKDALVERFQIKDAIYSGYLNEYISFSLVNSPLSLKGPSLHFLKLSKQPLTFDDYLTWKTIDEKALSILKEVVANPEGILCAGDFGSGKTTLFNVLLNSLPSEKSLVCIENEPGLTIHRERVARIMPRGRSHEYIDEALDAASLLNKDTIALNWMSERWASPFMNLLRNNARGIAVIGGLNPENAIDRLVRHTVISSDGYNFEEAAGLLQEVFKVIIFQEKISPKMRAITSIQRIEIHQGEIKLKPLYLRP